MIIIREIGKEKTGMYFVIYEVNNKVFTYNGTSKDVLEDLFKTSKEINDK